MYRVIKTESRDGLNRKVSVKDTADQGDHRISQRRGE